MFSPLDVSAVVGGGPTLSTEKDCILTEYKLSMQAYHLSITTGSGDGQTSWVYSNNPELHLYINCFVTVKKPVLSYLLLCLLPHFFVFRSRSLTFKILEKETDRETVTVGGGESEA